MVTNYWRIIGNTEIEKFQKHAQCKRNHVKNVSMYIYDHLFKYSIDNGKIPQLYPLLSTIRRYDANKPTDLTISEEINEMWVDMKFSLMKNGYSKQSIRKVYHELRKFIFSSIAPDMMKRAGRRKVA